MESMRTFCILILLFVASAGYSQTQVSTNTIINAKTNTFVWKGKTITDYSTGIAPTWRFITDGVSLLSDVFYTGGTTYTPFKVVEDKTFSESTNAIFTELKLKVTAQQLEDILRLAAEQPKEKEK